MTKSNANLHPEQRQLSLWLIFFVSLLLSGWGVVSPTVSNRWLKLPPYPWGDGPDYDMLAVSIGECGWWSAAVGDGLRIDTGNPTWRAPYEAAVAVAPASSPSYSDLLSAETQKRVSTGRPPLFPMMVAAVYQVTGRGESGFATVRVMLALSLAVSISLASVTTAILFRRVAPLAPFWSPAIAAASTLVLGVTNNTLKTYADDFLTEPIALLLMQSFLLCVLVGRSQDGGQSRTSATCAGVLFGLAILTRSMFVLWLPAIAVLAIASNRGTCRSRVASSAVMVGTAMLVCLPWWIRNYRVTEGYSPLGTKGMITLVGGYCDAAFQAGGDWQFGPEQELRAQLRSEQVASGEVTDDDPFVAGTRFEVKLAKRSRAEVIDWVRENAKETIQLVWMRIVTHWNPYTPKILLWKLACVAGALTLLVYSRREAWWILGLPLTSTLVVACLYSVGGRFLVPLYGILFCLPGITLALYWRKGQQNAG